jgi:hypothetical protein
MKSLHQAGITTVRYHKEWVHPDDSLKSQYRALESKFTGGVKRVELEDCEDVTWLYRPMRMPPRPTGPMRICPFHCQNRFRRLRQTPQSIHPRSTQDLAELRRKRLRPKEPARMAAGKIDERLTKHRCQRRGRSIRSAVGRRPSAGGHDPRRRHF